MAVTNDSDEPSQAPSPAGDASAGAGSQRTALGLLVLLYAAAVVLYAVLARRQPIPVISPDEFLYSTLARSLGDGEGLSWRGGSEPLRAALYVYAIVPAYLTDALTTAYETAKLEGAFLCSLVVVPTWLLARRSVGPLVALVPAALVVAGSWMLITADILTENLAYPLAAASLAAMVPAVSRPGSRWAWIALALAALAAWSRLQLAVLVGVLLVALVLDVARFGAAWRERAEAHRVALIALGALTGVGLVLAFAASESTLGIYSTLASTSPVSDSAGATGRQTVALFAMTGLLPLLVVIAFSLRREAWQDARSGPLLAVTWSAVVLLVLQSGWSLAALSDFVTWGIQRYTIYALPLVFTVATVALVRGRVPARLLGAVTLVVALAALVAEGVRNGQEDRALFALQVRFDELLGTSTGVSLAIATLVVGGLACLALAARGRGPALGAGAALALTVAVFAVQNQHAWSWQTDLTRAWRAGFPADLAWVDAAAKGPVARLVVTGNSARYEVTEFFNADIDQVYLPPGPVGGRSVKGRTCRWNATPEGVLTFQARCGPPPRTFFLDDEYGKLTLHDQQVVRDEPRNGRIVTVPPPGRPRLRSVVYLMCGPPLISLEITGRGRVFPARRKCPSSVLQFRFWLDEPATLRLRFRGGTTPQKLETAGRAYDIPPRALTTIRIPLPRGPVSLAAQANWSTPPPAAPDLVSAELVDRSGASSIVY